MFMTEVNLLSLFIVKENYFMGKLMNIWSESLQFLLHWSIMPITECEYLHVYVRESLTALNAQSVANS